MVTKPRTSIVAVATVYQLAGFTAVTMLAIATPSTSAFAQNEEGEASEYMRLVDYAVSEFARSNWDEARALFERAHRINPNARTFRGLGLVAFEMKEYVLAAFYLRQALLDERRALTVRLRRQVEGVLDRAEGFIGRIDVALSPEEANLEVDDDVKQVDEKGLLYLDPGTYQVRVSARGFRTLSKRITVEAGRRSELRLVLEPVQPDAAPATTGRSSAATRVDHADDDTPRWVGWGTGGVGAAGLALSWVFYADLLDKNQRLEETSAYRSVEGSGFVEAADEVRQAEMPPLISGFSGGVLVTAALPMLLPEREGMPWWSWAAGGAGLAGGAIAVVLFATEGDPIGETSVTEQTGILGSLLLSHSVPLISVPIVYFIRHTLSADAPMASIAIEPDGFELDIRGSF